MGIRSHHIRIFVRRSSFQCGKLAWWKAVVHFFQDTREEIFENILARNFSWPEDAEVSEEAQDFIDRLIDSDTSTRLGANGTHPQKKS